MLYDVGLNRGIRKKSLPEPNPQKIELPKDSDYHTVVEKAKDLNVFLRTKMMMKVLL